MQSKLHEMYNNVTELLLPVITYQSSYYDFLNKMTKQEEGKPSCIAKIEQGALIKDSILTLHNFIDTFLFYTRALLLSNNMRTNGKVKKIRSTDLGF
jgi:hypothetical protein